MFSVETKKADTSEASGIRQTRMLYQKTFYQDYSPIRFLISAWAVYQEG